MTVDHLVQDELDFTLISRVLARNWWVIVAVVVLGVIGSWFYTCIAPREYTTSCTFFMIPSEQGGGMGGVSRLFGGGGGGDLQKMIPLFVKSTRLKQAVSFKVATHFSKSGLGDVSLQLARDVRVSLAEDMKSGIFTLTASGPKANWLPIVLGSYVDELNHLNTDLDILPQKNIVKLLDPAEIPQQPSKPNTMRILLAGVVGSFALGVLLVFVMGYFQHKYTD